MKTCLRHAAWAWVIIAGTSCGFQPMEMQPAGEIPEGPGLFTGSDGAFTIQALRRPASQQSPASTGPATTKAPDPVK